MSRKIDIAIIGAGVIGLAIASRLSSDDLDILVLEQNDRFGRGISSRQSEVIHAGIYYPANSLKARLCLAGNRKLYKLCSEYGIGHSKPGKLIVAVNKQETYRLEELLKQGKDNGVTDLKLITQTEIKRLEPNVNGIAALFSPSSGIIDSWELMKYFESSALRNGVQFAYRTKVSGIEKKNDGYRITTDDDKNNSSFIAGIVINCAGLDSDKIASLAGIDIEKAGYRLHYCKGEYFSLSLEKSRLVKRLIFPLPPADCSGLGIHVTPDFEGRIKLGPSAQYVEKPDYSVSIKNQKLFYNSAKKLLPFIEYDDLSPDMAGIRPKLQEPGDVFRDFVIREESDKGLFGLINLIGIESPGLTASPAIADYVFSLI
jgi:L-2-hydroxyglutarate oxidase LhgO